jgi:hypothetical protein
MRWGSLRSLNSRDKWQIAFILIAILTIVLALWLDAQDRVLGIL